MSSSKLSFEQAIDSVAKEHGLDSNTEIQQQIIKRFHNVPFWRWDLPVEKHYRLYKQGKCNCYNCQIKWARKNNREYPLFDYEKRYLDALEKYRLVACIKARASGISEVTLRYMEWLALRNRKLAGSQFIIVSAPAEELSISFIRRIRAHLEPILGVFDSKEKMLMINGVRFETMPSHNLLRLRGITNVSFLTLEESAFWHKSEEEEILPIILPLRQKNSNMQIALTSTPGKLGSLMHQIHLAPQDKTPFYKVYIDWRQVVGKLFTKEEIDIARRTNFAFDREYALAFGFGMGNVFNPADLQKAIDLGKQHADPRFNEDCIKRPYPNTIYPEGRAVIGVDPGAAGSLFAICGIQLWNGKCHVFCAEQYERPNEDDMIDRILQLWNGTHGRANIFVDAANQSFIRKLKSEIKHGEQVDVVWQLEYLRRHGWAGKNDELIGRHMIVCPVSFFQLMVPGSYKLQQLTYSVTGLQSTQTLLNL